MCFNFVVFCGVFLFDFVCVMGCFFNGTKHETRSLLSGRLGAQNVLVPSSLNFFPPDRIFSWRYFFPSS